MNKLAHYALAGALLFSTAAPLCAQVSNTEAGVVYYMPRTELVLDLEYEEVTLKQGPFYQYSERYLGTKDIVLEEGVRYQLKSVRIASRTVADKNRAYTFVPLAGQKVVLNEKGILCGIGIEPTAKGQQGTAEKGVGKGHAAEGKGHAAPASESIIQNPFAGLMEEQMLASSLSKMAEGAAKQIYHIREARMNWLCGDVENMPADGASLQRILKELDRQEQQLTALFVGTEQRKTLHRTITLEAKDYADEVVVRFSALTGPVEADDLSGEPIYLTATAQRQAYTEESKKSAAASPLYYNLPGTLHLTLSDSDGLLQEKTVQVGQFGISVPLPAATFKQASVIRLDEKTGALLAIDN